MRTVHANTGMAAGCATAVGGIPTFPTAAGLCAPGDLNKAVAVPELERMHKALEILVARMQQGSARLTNLADRLFGAAPLATTGAECGARPGQLGQLLDLIDCLELMERSAEEQLARLEKL